MGAQRDPEDGQDFWRVAIVEDHLLQRERTQEILDGEDGLRVVGTFETLPEFTRAWDGSAVRRRPHLLVLDLMVDRGPRAEAATVERLVGEGLRVLLLSAMASASHVREMLHAGVDGIVGKRDRPEAIVEASWAVLRRERWVSSELAAVIAGDVKRPSLSIQEERALTLYASGLTLPEVATMMNVSAETAKSYLARVKKKYAEVGRPVSSKLDLSRVATVDGLIDEPS